MLAPLTFFQTSQGDIQSGMVSLSLQCWHCIMKTMAGQNIYYSVCSVAYIKCHNQYPTYCHFSVGQLVHHSVLYFLWPKTNGTCGFMMVYGRTENVAKVCSGANCVNTCGAEISMQQPTIDKFWMSRRALLWNSADCMHLHSWPYTARTVIVSNWQVLLNSANPQS